MSQGAVRVVALIPRPKLNGKIEFRESDEIVARLSALAARHPKLAVTGSAARVCMRAGLAVLEDLEREGLL